MSLAPHVATDDAVATLGLRHKVRITDHAKPLVVLVHGRAGNYDVMWTFRRAIPDEYSVLLPQAPLDDPIGGFSWWQVGERGQREDAPAQAAAESLLQFLERARCYYNLNPSCILAAGFSQGAALISVLLQKEANPLHGAALLAGFVLKQESPIRGKTSSILVAHGTNDDVVPIEMAELGASFLKGLGYPVQFLQDPVGHKIGSGSVRALTSWVSSFGSGELK